MMWWPVMEMEHIIFSAFSGCINRELWKSERQGIFAEVEVSIRFIIADTIITKLQNDFLGK